MVILLLHSESLTLITPKIQRYIYVQERELTNVCDQLPQNNYLYAKHVSSSFVEYTLGNEMNWI